MQSFSKPYDAGKNYNITIKGSGITYFAADNMKLKSISVSGLTELEYLSCNTDELTSLNVSGLTTLEYLDCSGNQLTTLNVSGLTALTLLGCAGNKFATAALDAIFAALPDLSGVGSNGKITVGENPATTGWIYNGSDPGVSVMTAKGWDVTEYL